MHTSFFTIFAAFPHIHTSISTRHDGSTKIPSLDDKSNETQKNRKRFLQKNNIEPQMLVSAKLGHTNNVHIVTEDDKGTWVAQTDGLMTDKKGIYLSVTLADCPPMFLYDPKKESIGLLHVGWKGLAKEIIPQAIRMFEKEYHSNPADLLIGIGPGIGVCHFEVADEVREQFQAYPEAIEQRDNRFFINLQKVAITQLVTIGCQEKNIEVSPLCTHCESDVYFSYRRKRTVPAKVMMAIMGME